MTDADLRAAMVAALQTIAVLSVLAMALFWWRVNWQSGLLVLIGGAVSAASLWEWLRMITAVNARMDASKKLIVASSTAEERPQPITQIVLAFCLRLCLTLAILYASLKYLHGTAFALAAGLAMGVVALSVEAVRLLRRA